MRKSQVAFLNGVGHGLWRGALAGAVTAGAIGMFQASAAILAGANPMAMVAIAAGKFVTAAVGFTQLGILGAGLTAWPMIAVAAVTYGMYRGVGDYLEIKEKQRDKRVLREMAQEGKTLTGLDKHPQIQQTIPSPRPVTVENTVVTPPPETYPPPSKEVHHHYHSDHTHEGDHAISHQQQHADRSQNNQNQPASSKPVVARHETNRQASPSHNEKAGDDNRHYETQNLQQQNSPSKAYSQDHHTQNISHQAHPHRSNTEHASPASGEYQGERSADGASNLSQTGWVARTQNPQNYQNLPPRQNQRNHEPLALPATTAGERGNAGDTPEATGNQAAAPQSAVARLQAKQQAAPKASNAAIYY